MKKKILACLLSTSCIMAIIVRCSNKQTTVKASNTVDNSLFALLVPCLKGRKFWVNYTATGTTNAFKFIYAEGEI